MWFSTSWCPAVAFPAPVRVRISARAAGLGSPSCSARTALAAARRRSGRFCGAASARAAGSRSPPPEPRWHTSHQCLRSLPHGRSAGSVGWPSWRRTSSPTPSRARSPTPSRSSRPTATGACAAATIPRSVSPESSGDIGGCRWFERWAERAPRGLSAGSRCRIAAATSRARSRPGSRSRSASC